MTQPFFSTEQFTGKAGKRVPLDEALEGCDRILNDEFADYSEQALYMLGAVSEAEKKSSAEDTDEDTDEDTAEPTDPDPSKSPDSETDSEP